jgi:GAF domain-containing protein
LTSIGARSFQGTALRVGDEQLGVLYVNYNQPRGFTTEDKRTLETFAHHAALALKKARLLKQVSKAKKAAEVVARVTVLGKGEEPLRSVVDGTREAVGCDAVVLYVYDQSMAKLDHPPTMVGVDFPDQAKRYEEVAPDSIVYTMLRHSGPYIVERIAEDELFSRTRFARDEKIESCVAIPLGLAEQTVGVMFVNYRAYHRFTSNELANIELFANQAAVAIRNAQLYRESQERARVLESLYQAAQIVTRSLSLPDVLQMIAEQAWKLAEPSGEKQAQLSHVALREGNTLSFVAAYPLEHLAGLRSQVGDVDLERGPEGRIGISGRAVKTGQIQRVGRVTEHPDYIRYDEKTRSELAVPLTIDGNAIGVINVEHPDHDAFDEEDEKALKALAAQAAIAIQNARRYEELRKAKGLIGARTALAWMGMASSTWRHAIDKHAVTIREQAQLLRQSWSSLPPPSGDDKAPERLGIIERLATQILDKPITPPLSMEEGLESVALNALVGERARQLWQGDPYSQATLRLDLELADGSTVRASPEWLRRAFELLVDNAVAALTGRPVREVTIGTRQVQGGAEILVCDTGPGIPEDIQAKVGLELIERPEDAMGLGMGLLMAQTVVQTYGGEIRVGTTGPAGTTMVIWLPLEEQADAGRRR